GRPRRRQFDSSNLPFVHYVAPMAPSWSKSIGATPLPIPNFVGRRRYGSQTMRSFPVAERRARLGRRLFLSEPATSVVDLVGRVIGLHATDPATPYLSLWARLPG